MGKDLIHYEFVNSETDNVIGYLSLPVNMDENERRSALEKKQTELAMSNGLYFDLIYWRNSDHPVWNQWDVVRHEIEEKGKDRKCFICQA